MKVLSWLRPAAPSAKGTSLPQPSLRALTVMLTELCNLDCWMCDFASSKGQQQRLPWSPEDLVAFLSHRHFAGLRRIVFTGGEPFVHPGIRDIYSALQDRFPDLTVAFSSNATLHGRMAETFRLCRDWRRTKLMTSIDGLEMHDVQRGMAGAFDKSFGNLQKLRSEFPRLGIELKFTITPRNHHELLAAWEHCTRHGFAFTAKFVENNAYYTNRLSFDEHREDFQFTAQAIDDVRRQLDTISARAPRHRTMRELRDSLASGWQRSGRCATPSQGAFLDSRLNLFTCKEYPPVLNLGRQSLDDLATLPGYAQVCSAEAANAAHCTRCTSPQKLETVRMPWDS